MMLILAIDPGVTTGYALYDPNIGQCIDHFQSNVSLQVAEWIHKAREKTRVIVIEDFIGQGKRDEHVKITLKNLGLFEGYARILKYEVTLQQPQFRKAFYEAAAKMVGYEMHYTDALAHALAYAYWHAKATGVEPYVLPSGAR